MRDFEAANHHWFRLSVVPVILKVFEDHNIYVHIRGAEKSPAFYREQRRKTGREEEDAEHGSDEDEGKEEIYKCG